MSFKNLQKGYARIAFKLDIDARRRLWLKLAKLLSNGVPILVAIGTMKKRMVDIGNGSHPTAIALGEWAIALNSGKRFSDAIAPWVTQEEMMIISGGEQSGQIERTLQSVARIMVAKKKIKGAIITGTIYPLILFSMAIAVLVMFGYKIIPTFEQAAPHARWTGQAAMMIHVSKFVQSWLVYGIVATILVMAAFFASLPRFDGALRVKLDQYAPYSLYRIVQGASWLIAFSALIEAGTRMEKALEQMAAQSSPWLKNRLHSCLRQMRSGHSLGDALVNAGQGFPDKEIVDDLGVYASLSGFDQALQMLGKEWIEEAVEAINARMKVVFGLSILAIGSTIAFMVGGLFAIQEQMAQALKTVPM